MEPRIPPVSVADADPEVRRLLERLSQLRGDDASLLNVFGTLANHPTLMREWIGFGTYVLTRTTLDPRTRELVVLRVGWRCDAPYEWGQHIVVGRAVGLTDADVARVAEGPDAEGWTEAEALALRATDELHDRSTITTTTWGALGGHYSPQQILDLVFLVGEYTLVSYALNACAVQRDDGVDDDAALPFPPAAR
ncbi:MAG: carboxymuconolactone decarboxylase family protein [Acidimicrobiia bacterium]